MKNDEIIQQLGELSVEDWVTVVGQAAHDRFTTLKQTNSNAATFHTISRECQRLRKILKRVTL